MKKKENKTMKKVLTVSALALLLGLVGYTGGSTFAKYISSGSTGSQTATVAKWGLTATANIENLFGEEYDSVADGLAKVSTDHDKLVVKSATSAGNIVAPGTTGSMTFTLQGQAEVDASVDFTSAMDDISIDGYYPIKWTVTRSTNGQAAVTVVNGLSANDVNTYFNGLDFTYNAGSEALNEVFVVSWAWAFSGQDDAKDTLLGQEAPGADIQMGVNLTVTFTQIQDETN